MIFLTIVWAIITLVLIVGFLVALLVGPIGFGEETEPGAEWILAVIYSAISIAVLEQWF